MAKEPTEPYPLADRELLYIAAEEATAAGEYLETSSRDKCAEKNLVCASMSSPIGPLCTAESDMVCMTAPAERQDRS